MEGKKHGTAATRAKNKYNAKAYDRISIIVPAGEKDVMDGGIKKLGYASRNEFIVAAIKEKLEREKQNI